MQTWLRMYNVYNDFYIWGLNINVQQENLKVKKKKVNKVKSKYKWAK